MGDGANAAPCAVCGLPLAANGWHSCKMCRRGVHSWTRDGCEQWMPEFGVYFCSKQCIETFNLQNHSAYAALDADDPRRADLKFSLRRRPDDEPEQNDPEPAAREPPAAAPTAAPKRKAAAAPAQTAAATRPRRATAGTSDGLEPARAGTLEGFFGRKPAGDAKTKATTDTTEAPKPPSNLPRYRSVLRQHLCQHLCQHLPWPKVLRRFNTCPALKCWVQIEVCAAVRVC